MKPLIQNELEVKDSFDFKDFILNQKVTSKSDCMVSFDVSSLFTNVPLNETIELCGNLWDEKNKANAMIDKHGMIELLKFCTKEVSFLFNDEWYTQMDGVAMGSPLGPTMASIFMKEIEGKISNYEGNKPTVYKRYVDDIFLIFNSRDDVGPFLNFMNNLHNNIKFTTEFENENKLSFLDILIKRIDNLKYETSIYRKPTDTGLYTTANSFCEEKYKSGMIKGLIHRVWTLTSDHKTTCNELDLLRDRLSKNAYGMKMIERNIKKSVDKLMIPNLGSKEADKIKEQKEIKEEFKNIVKIPYSDGFRRFKASIKQVVGSDPNFKVISTTFKSKNFLSTKSRTPLSVQANVVYKFQCHGCKHQYIGETYRHLKTRISEHTQSSRTSKVLDHIKSCTRRSNTAVDDEFGVLMNNFDTSLERLLCESLMIKCHNPEINVQNGEGRTPALPNVFN